MKISKERLKQIIQEELENIFSEQEDDVSMSRKRGLTQLLRKYQANWRLDEILISEDPRESAAVLLTKALGWWSDIVRRGKLPSADIEKIKANMGELQRELSVEYPKTRVALRTIARYVPTDIKPEMARETPFGKNIKLIGGEAADVDDL